MTSKNTPDTLLDAVNSSISAAFWIKPQDTAISELCRVYAAAIDAGGDNSSFLGTHLQRALDSLGLTPESRAKGIGALPQDEEDELADMRKKRGA